MNAGRWAVDGTGQWSITYQRKYIGQTGFFDARRGVGAGFDGVPECGWVIAPAHLGQGFATEAGVAMHRWFDEGHVESRTLITVGHVASERLAARLGYRQFRVVGLHGVAYGLSRRTRKV